MKTIAAISTPIGHGGISIVRISGEDALEIIEKIFVPKNKGKLKPYTLKFGNIIDSNMKCIDQVLISYFKAPKTYTGEDICEINCHGRFDSNETNFRISSKKWCISCRTR